MHNVEKLSNFPNVHITKNGGAKCLKHKNLDDLNVKRTLRNNVLQLNRIVGKTFLKHFFLLTELQIKLTIFYFIFLIKGHARPRPT